MKCKPMIYPLIGLVLGLGLQSQASATRISVTVENLSPDGGLYFTPVWVGFHDGSFDSFDVGGNASAAIEAIAEGGDPAGLQAAFGGIQDLITAPAGFPLAPVFDPGDIGSVTVDLNPANNRYFSFASMVIPSNDAFIGNDDGMAYEIFDATGVFTGPLEIFVLGSEIWDAGTELNDGLGAAFSALGGVSTDEMMAIGAHTGLDALFGSMTAAGTTIDGAVSDITANGFQLAKITINAVPEPGLIAMLGLGFGLMRVVRSRKRDNEDDALTVAV